MAQSTEMKKVDLNAGESIDNVLSQVGSKLENIPTDANYRVTLAAQADSLDVEHSLSVDTDEAVQKSVVGSDGGTPRIPDDVVDQVAVEGGSKLYLSVDNTDSSGSHTYVYKLRITPLS